MWLIITLIAAIISSAGFFLLKSQRRKLKLGFLALMLIGTFIMVLVDHVIAFIAGEPFIEATTDGLIGSGAILGLLMVLSVFVIWLISVFTKHFSKHAA